MSQSRVPIPVRPSDGTHALRAPIDQRRLGASHRVRDEVAASQLAVDAQIEERKLAHAAFHLQADSKRPDLVDLERRLLPNDLSLVPRFTIKAQLEQTLLALLRNAEQATEGQVTPRLWV